VQQKPTCLAPLETDAVGIGHLGIWVVLDGDVKPIAAFLPETPRRASTSTLQHLNTLRPKPIRKLQQKNIQPLLREIKFITFVKRPFVVVEGSVLFLVPNKKYG